MASDRFPVRLFTKGEEPPAGKSINYYAGHTNLFIAFDGGLLEDEKEELRNSPLGVCLRLHELPYKWASRLVYNMLALQLQCKKPFEIWSLIGVKPARFSLNEFELITSLNCDDVPNLVDPDVVVTEESEEFWELLGVNIERGPSIVELEAACSSCSDWTRENRMRLGYLCIYAGYIEAKKETTPINVNLARLVMDIEAFRNYPWGRVAMKFLITSVKKIQKDLDKSSYTIEGFVHVLQGWVYYALPDYATEFAFPLPNNPAPHLLAFHGSKGRKNVKENILKQSNVRTCVRTPGYEQMFPRWDDDAADEKITNIISEVYEMGFKWTCGHWKLTGISSFVKKENNKRSRELSYSAVEEDLPSLLRTLQAHFDQNFRGLTKTVANGFASCEKKIKVLGDKVEAIEKSLDAAKGGKGRKGEKRKTKEVLEKIDGDKSPNPQEQTKSNEPAPAPAKAAPLENNKVDDAAKGKSLPDVGSEFLNMETCKADGQSESVNGADSSVMFIEKQNVQAKFVEVQKAKQDKKLIETQQFVREKSLRVKNPGRGQSSPYLPTQTAKSKVTVGKRYDPFAPLEEHKMLSLQNWLQLQPGYNKDNSIEPPPFTSLQWFWILQKPEEWLKDTHMDAAMNMMRKRYVKNIAWFRSEKICFLDTTLGMVWNMRYNEFLASTPNPDGTGRALPGGAWDYYAGKMPEYKQRVKTWGTEVEDIDMPLHVRRIHWIALWISIPKRHITIWDSAATFASDDEIKEKVDPIVVMLPHLIRECCLAEDRHKWPLTPFTYARLPATKVPQNKQSGDCGVYSLKYIECHALGYTFSLAALCDRNIKRIRDKLAADIFTETDFRGIDTQTYKGLDLYDQK